jgi:hypothetical protein
MSQHLPILLPYGDKELVYRHGHVDGNFTPEERFDDMFLCDLIGGEKEGRPGKGGD